MNQYPQNDSKYQDETITQVREGDDGWEIGIRGSAFFYLSKPSPVEPKVGMTCRTYGLMGHPIRGVFLDGQQVYYRTEEEESKRHAEEVAASDVKKKADFEANRAVYETRVAALPEIFRRRIKKFQDTNPDFDWEFGGYELFVCEQAWVFVTTLGTLEALDAWNKLPYEKQKEQVPALDDGHSGNTFGCAVRLAYHYLTEQENVVREHGALVPLVGCDRYGCDHSKPT